MADSTFTLQSVTAAPHFPVDDDSGTLQVQLLIDSAASSRDCMNAAEYLHGLAQRALNVVAWDLAAEKGTVSEDPKDAAALIHAAQALLSLAHNISEAGRQAAGREGGTNGR